MQRAAVLKDVASHGMRLAFVPEQYRGDREVVLAAIAQNCYALEHASEEIRADRDFMLAAVAQRGDALQHASEALKADHDFVLAAMAQNYYALEYASNALKADRAFALAAAVVNGHALDYVSAELKADRCVVQAAVAQRVSALQYASAELRCATEDRPRTLCIPSGPCYSKRPDFDPALEQGGPRDRHGRGGARRPRHRSRGGRVSSVRLPGVKLGARRACMYVMSLPRSNSGVRPAMYKRTDRRDPGGGSTPIHAAAKVPSSIPRSRTAGIEPWCSPRWRGPAGRCNSPARS